MRTFEDMSGGGKHTESEAALLAILWASMNTGRQHPKDLVDCQSHHTETAPFHRWGHRGLWTAVGVGWGCLAQAVQRF